MDVKKEVLNKLGLCEICGEPLRYNEVHYMTGVVNTAKERFICSKCKTKMALEKFQGENKDEETNT